MPIKVECPQCDAAYRVGDETAGKKVRCKACGTPIKVPQPDDTTDDVEEVEDVEEEVPRPSSLRSRKPKAKREKPRKKKSTGGLTLRQKIGLGAGGGLLFVLLIAFVFAGRKDTSGNLPFPVEQVPIPSFANLGAPRILQPSGVRMWFVQMPASSKPGQSMAMRLYLPPTDAPEHSIPCVLVAPAGTNLLMGNDMDADDYHAETLPYAQAGMAVVFYSLDGGLADLDNAKDDQVLGAYQRFKAAYAGIVNGRNALEFLLAKVPQVNPRRIYTAGHSSAGTLSLLLAEHEPRLAGSIAYAPASDVEKRLASVTQDVRMRIMFSGLMSFVQRSSPKTHVARIQCPLFLFHANDDNNVSVTESQAFAQQLQAAGKTVELQTVPTGGHYNSMIQQGIPKAIEWLNRLNAK